MYKQQYLLQPRGWSKSGLECFYKFTGNNAGTSLVSRIDGGFDSNTGHPNFTPLQLDDNLVIDFWSLRKSESNLLTYNSVDKGRTYFRYNNNTNISLVVNNATGKCKLSEKIGNKRYDKTDDPQLLQDLRTEYLMLQGSIHFQQQQPFLKGPIPNTKNDGCDYYRFANNPDISFVVDHKIGEFRLSQKTNGSWGRYINPALLDHSIQQFQLLQNQLSLQQQNNQFNKIQPNKPSNQQTNFQQQQSQFNNNQSQSTQQYSPTQNNVNQQISGNQQQPLLTYVSPDINKDGKIVASYFNCPTHGYSIKVDHSNNNDVYVNDSYNSSWQLISEHSMPPILKNQIFQEISNKGTFNLSNTQSNSKQPPQQYQQPQQSYQQPQQFNQQNNMQQPPQNLQLSENQKKIQKLFPIDNKMSGPDGYKKGAHKQNKKILLNEIAKEIQSAGTKDVLRKSIIKYLIVAMQKRTGLESWSARTTTGNAGLKKWTSGGNLKLLQEEFDDIFRGVNNTSDTSYLHLANNLKNSKEFVDSQPQQLAHEIVSPVVSGIKSLINLREIWMGKTGNVEKGEKDVDCNSVTVASNFITTKLGR